MNFCCIFLVSRISYIAKVFSLPHYGGVPNAIFNLKGEMDGNQCLLEKILLTIGLTLIL